MRNVTRREWLVGLAPIVAVVATGEAFASGRWTLIGRRDVSDRLDHDTLALPSRARYEALQVKVHGHAVQFRDLKVHFANGGTEDVALRDVIRSGGQSRVIDLQGRDRDIERIELWYDAQTARRGRRARVEVWGRRD
jgi:hypothetical protein